MKKVHRLLSMTDGDERKHVLDYTHVDLHYMEDQRKNLVNKFNLLKQEISLHKSELSKLKNTVSINCSLQNEVIRVNLENESLKDEISDLKKVIKKWTCSKVTLDQLLSEQVPSDIVKALGGKTPEITPDSESKCDTQEPLPPLPKLIGTAPTGTSGSLISLTDLTFNMADLLLRHVPKKTKPSVKVSPTYVIKKKTETKLPTVPELCPDKCKVCGIIAHEPSHCPKKHPNSRRQGLPTGNQNPLKSGLTKGTNLCENVYAGLPQEACMESGPKVVFRGDSSGDTEGYGSVNCNGITFTMVAYVNGLKHNLISISQLCDANYKVLFIKTQGTIYNQNDEVVLIAPRRRDVYVIDMSSFNKESNACFFAKASLSKKSDVADCIISFIRKMENLNKVRVKELRSDNGTEFRNHKLEEFCVEKARTMLNSAKLPKQFWGEAVNTTCFTQNRSIIVKRHGKTSYDVFRGRSPDISYFYVFGCPLHIHNHKDHLGKFNEKADDGFFLGYSSVAKAFRVFNIRRQEMEEIVHVTFSEDDESISQSTTPSETPLSVIIIPAFSEHNHFESGDNLEPAKIKDNVIIEPINDTQSSPTTISPLPESILQTPIPQDI
ncbi:retrovirus-related pol polyprotein from transposon TNT 1-94 [Tanacetum coccineum]